MTTATAVYTIDSTEIQNFLSAWHENGRAPFERFTPGLDYDTYYPKTATDRKKYVALDYGTSGCFLVEKVTGAVYTIKGYGRANRCIGHIVALTGKFIEATASHRAIRLH